METELCPISDEALESAKSRFHEAVTLCRQVVAADRAWAKLGRLLSEIDDSKGYEHLGYDSMGQCIVAICVMSDYERASLYRFKALWPLVAKHAAQNALDMRIGSADAFVRLPEYLQRDERIQMLASEAPEKFKATIREQHPEVHWEDDKVFKFPDSRWQVIKSVLDFYRNAEQEDCTDQEALEACLVDYRMIRQQLEEMQRATEAHEGR